MAHRAALEHAVAGLPTLDDGSWSVPDQTLEVAGLQDDVVGARRFVLEFSEWAREAICRLPSVTQMQATDFNDYYKLVMSRVQLLYAQALTPPKRPMWLTCQFETQIRRRPTFIKDGVVRTLGCFDVKCSHLEGVTVVGSLDTSIEAFRATLRAVGARRFDRVTLALLIKSRDQAAAAIEESLALVNEEWIAALDGQHLFNLLDEGAEFSKLPDVVEAKVMINDGKAVVIVQGPWFRVTFCETPVRVLTHLFSHTPCMQACPAQHAFHLYDDACGPRVAHTRRLP